MFDGLIGDAELGEGVMEDRDHDIDGHAVGRGADDADGMRLFCGQEDRAQREGAGFTGAETTTEEELSGGAI